MTVVVLIICIVAALLVGIVVGARLRVIAGHRGPAPRAGTSRAGAATTPGAPAPVAGTTSEPDVADTTSEPDVPDTTSEPDVPETTSEPDVPETTAEPPVPDTTAEPPVPSGDDHDRRVLESVWQLQRLDLEVNRRRDAGLSTAAGPDHGPPGLAEAVQQEIARTREEIGTPGAFRSDLDSEPDSAAALLLLRSVQSTLDFVARRSQAFDLHLHADEHELAVTVLCDDFEGEPPDTGVGDIDLSDVRVADPSVTGAGPDTAPAGASHPDAAVADAAQTDAAAIAGAIAPAGGLLVFGRDPDGRVRAKLSVPGS